MFWIIGGLSALPGFLYAVEFFADKIPYVDSVWDVVHTFIRVPAGALMAYAATNEMDASVYTIATLVGGGFAFSSHGTKAAFRAGANLSPEPVSNWVVINRRRHNRFCRRDFCGFCADNYCDCVGHFCDFLHLVCAENLSRHSPNFQRDSRLFCGRKL